MKLGPKFTRWSGARSCYLLLSLLIPSKSILLEMKEKLQLQKKRLRRKIPTSQSFSLACVTTRAISNELGVVGTHPSIIRVTAVTLMSGMGVLRMIVPLPVLFLLHTFHSRIRTSKEWNYKGGTGRKLQSPARMLAYDWNLHECWRLDEWQPVTPLTGWWPTRQSSMIGWALSWMCDPTFPSLLESVTAAPFLCLAVTSQG